MELQYQYAKLLGQATDQDCENETTIWSFSDGSKLRVSGVEVGVLS